MEWFWTRELTIIRKKYEMAQNNVLFHTPYFYAGASLSLCLHEIWATSAITGKISGESLVSFLRRQLTTLLIMMSIKEKRKRQNP